MTKQRNGGKHCSIIIPSFPRFPHTGTQASGIWILGRTVLNLWRHLRSELKLRNYSRAEVVAHVLDRR